MPKNPYTNECFSKAVLLHIYDRVRRSDYRMPVLFEYFFQCFFSIADFTHEHEAVIRDRHIQRLVKYGDVEVLSHYIYKMLRYTRVFPHMDPHFPKTQLVSIFRPYVAIYLHHFFSTIYSEKKERAYVLLHRQLNHLYEYNPKLGQRIVMRRQGFDCPVNRDKLRGKFLIISSTNKDDVEVFCIDHLPPPLTNRSISTTYNIFLDDEEDDEDEF
jgi:hypothetical protein